MFNLKNRPYLFNLLCLLSIIGTLAGYYWLIYSNVKGGIPCDFQLLFYSAKDYLVFNNPYLVPMTNIDHSGLRVIPSTNLAAPLLIYLISVVARLLSHGHAFILWTALITLALFAGVYTSQKYLLNIDIKKKYLAHAAFFALLSCTFYNFPFGQCGMLFFLGISLFLIAYNKQRFITATFILAVMTAFKLFFLLFVLFFMAKKQYRYLAIYLFFVAALILLPIWDNLLPTYHAYVIVTDHIRWYLTNWNASFQGFFSRLFGSTQSLQTAFSNHPEIAHALYYFFGCIYAGLAFLACRRSKDTLLCVGIILSAALLISPLGWLYYFPIFYFPFLHTEKLINKREKNLLLTLLLYTCLFLVSSSFPFITREHPDKLYLLFWGNIPFIALLLFCNIQLYLALSSTTHANGPPVIDLPTRHKMLILFFIMNLICVTLTVAGFSRAKNNRVHAYAPISLMKPEDRPDMSKVDSAIRIYLIGRRRNYDM
jgi:hypothetical protein